MLFIDNQRLFPGSTLYCEGRHKPFFRGKIHAFGAAALCPYWGYIAARCVSSVEEYAAFTMFFVGTILCWSCSALYHCKGWTSSQEILMQRLDHSAIFICIACSFSPLSILVNNQDTYYVLVPILVMTWLFSGFGVYNACRGNRGERSVMLSVLNVAIMTPSIPYVAIHMTNLEKLLAIFSMIFLFVGALAFDKEVINPLPNVFGYHEVFHLCTLISAFLMFSLYLSMIAETDIRCLQNDGLYDQTIHYLGHIMFGADGICN